jgi:hypothetical protein
MALNANSKLNTIIFASLSLFVIGCATEHRVEGDAKTILNMAREVAQSDLLGEIAAMAASDSYERRLFINSSQDASLPAAEKAAKTARLQALVTQRDMGRTRRLKAILASTSLTQIAQMDPNVASAAMLIIDHSDDTAFQRQLADEIVDLGKAKIIDPQQVANFTDKLALGEGKPQVYGTQLSCSSKDGGPLTWGPTGGPADAELEARRNALGLEPYSEYQAQLIQLYGPCTEAYVIKPAK